MQIINQLIFDQFAAGQWFSPRTPVSSTNKTDRNDITEILLKVVLKLLYLKYNITSYILEWHPIMWYYIIWVYDI
jgi:hypothetical protein